MAKHAGTMHDELQQEIGELERTIDALEDHRSRLIDLAPGKTVGTGGDAGSLWSDIAEIVSDLIEVVSERAAEGPFSSDKREGEDSAAAELRRDVSAAMKRLRRGGRGRKSSSLEAADRGAIEAVIAGLDTEIARFRADQQLKAGELAALDAVGDPSDQGPTPAIDHAPVQPHVDDPVVMVVDVEPPPPVFVIEPVAPDVTPVPGPVDDVVEPRPVDDVIPPEPVVVVVGPEIEPVPVQPFEPTEPVSFDPGTQVEMGELDGAVYDVNDLMTRGVSVADLRRADVPAGVLRASGLAASDLISAGYSVGELREAMFGADELVGQVAAGMLRDAGFSASELNHSGIDWVELAAAGFSVDELRSAGADDDSLRALFPHDFPPESDVSSPSYWSSP